MEGTDGHREDSPTGAWGEAIQAANRLSPAHCLRAPWRMLVPDGLRPRRRVRPARVGGHPKGEGSAASADLEAGATRQGAGVSPDG